MILILSIHFAPPMFRFPHCAVGWILKINYQAVTLGWHVGYLGHCRSLRAMHIISLWKLPSVRMEVFFWEMGTLANRKLLFKYSLLLPPAIPSTVILNRREPFGREVLNRPKPRAAQPSSAPQRSGPRQPKGPSNGDCHCHFYLSEVRRGLGVHSSQQCDKSLGLVLLWFTETVLLCF